MIIIKPYTYKQYIKISIDNILNWNYNRMNISYTYQLNLDLPNNFLTLISNSKSIYKINETVSVNDEGMHVFEL